MYALRQPESDGLYVPKKHVGNWSRNKHHFLKRYVDAFLTAMRHKTQWKGLHYIDLFAGAGLEYVDGYGLDWGSPLIAAQHPIRFSHLHLCEIGKRKVEVLRQRLTRIQQPCDPQVIRGDANMAVEEVVGAIPTGTLSLAFLDPYGLHLHFSTLERLATRQCDLVIFFPDHLDALRNWRFVYRDQPSSNLELVLGTSAWPQVFSDSPPDNWANRLTALYVDQIRKLGYGHFDFERITRDNGRFLYRLIFCCRKKIGGDIWARIATTKLGGQSTFDFT